MTLEINDIANLQAVPPLTSHFEWQSSSVPGGLSGRSPINSLVLADGSNPFTGAIETNTGTLLSNVADGAGSVAIDLNTVNPFNTAGGKLFRVRNNGTEKAYIDKDGVICSVGATTTLTMYAEGGSSWEAAINSTWGLSFDTGNSAGILFRGPSEKSSSNRTGIGYDGIRSGRDAGNWTHSWNSQLADTLPASYALTGQAAFASAVTNLKGGALSFKGGDGASGSLGNAHGGDIVFEGGQEYGTGNKGDIILANLRTTAPSATGGIWNDAGTIKIV